MMRKTLRVPWPGWLLLATLLLAGWVLLPDGRQAGVIQTDTQQIAAPHLNPTRPTISLPGGGKLTAQLVTPDSDF